MITTIKKMYKESVYFRMLLLIKFVMFIGISYLLVPGLNQNVDIVDQYGDLLKMIGLLYSIIYLFLFSKTAISLLPGNKNLKQDLSWLSFLWKYLVLIILMIIPLKILHLIALGIFSSSALGSYLAVQTVDLVFGGLTFITVVCAPYIILQTGQVRTEISYFKKLLNDNKKTLVGGALFMQIFTHHSLENLLGVGASFYFLIMYFISALLPAILLGNLVYSNQQVEPEL